MSGTPTGALPVADAVTEAETRVARLARRRNELGAQLGTVLAREADIRDRYNRALVDGSADLVTIERELSGTQEQIRVLERARLEINDLHQAAERELERARTAEVERGQRLKLARVSVLNMRETAARRRLAAARQIVAARAMVAGEHLTREAHDRLVLERDLSRAGVPLPPAPTTEPAEDDVAGWERRANEYAQLVGRAADREPFATLD